MNADRSVLGRLTHLVLAASTIAAGVLLASFPARAAEDPAPIVEPAADEVSLFGSYLAGRQASGDRDRLSAAEYFADALALDPDNRMLLERTMVYQLSAGRFDDALALAPRVLDAAPNNLGANVLLGLKAMRDGNFAGAKARFATNDSGPIARLASELLTMWAHQAAGETEDARKLVAQLDEASTFGAFRTYHSGLLAQMQGRDADAESAYASAYDSAPGLRTVDAYGRFLESHGRQGKAIEIYKTFLEESPNHPIIAAALARAESGAVAEPLVADAYAGAAETLYAMGSALTQDGGGDLALIYLNLAAYTYPDLSIAHFLIADIHDRQERHEEAIAAYTAVADDSPLNREAEIQAALNLDALDRTDEARARLDGLIEADPADRTALVSAGTLLRARQRFDEALPYYEKAIALIAAPGRNDWQLFYFRGICYERTDAWPKAEADFLRALEVEPDQPLVLNYLGYSWIDFGMHLDRALGMVEKAVEQRPDDGYIVDSLGWAYYRLGDYERAVDELERAVELRPDDPVINDHLGDGYWRVGRNLEARFQWDHALALEPEDEEIPKIRAKLESGLSAIDVERVVVAGTGETADAATVEEAAAALEESGQDSAGEAEEATARALTPEPEAEVEPAVPSETSEDAAPEAEDAVASAASPEAQEPVRHTVERGDTLWGIATRFLGRGALYDLIFDANRDQIESDYRIYPGEALVIPEKP